MLPRAWVLIVAVPLVVAGCFGATPGAPGPDPEPGGAGPKGPPVLDFSKCGELNTLLPVASENRAFPSGIRPVPVDSQGRILYEISTLLVCDDVLRDNVSLAKPFAALFTLFTVSAVDGLSLSGAAGYLYGDYVASPAWPVNSLFGDVGTKAENGTVNVVLSSVGRDASNRGSATVRAPGHEMRSVESFMEGSAATRAGGFLGFYTANETHLRLHKVTYTEYRSYPTGQAFVTYDYPAAGAVSPNVEQATHNFGLDLRFAFDVASKAR